MQRQENHGEMMIDDRLTTSQTPGTGSDAGNRTEAHLRALRAHWEEMRRGHLVPARSDIDPRRIEALLPHAFVAERVAPGVTRLRIAGTLLSDLMGMDVRGMPLSCFIAPAQRDAFALAQVDLFDAPAALRIDLRLPAGPGRPERTGSLVMLPLRSDLGDVSRALGCLVTQGPAGRSPIRFDIARTLIERLDRPDRAMPRLRAVEGNPTVPALRKTAGRAHLRVVR